MLILKKERIELSCVYLTLRPLYLPRMNHAGSTKIMVCLLYSQVLQYKLHLQQNSKDLTERIKLDDPITSQE